MTVKNKNEDPIKYKAFSGSSEIRQCRSRKARLVNCSVTRK